jgi:hypothetical protein
MLIYQAIFYQPISFIGLLGDFITFEIRTDFEF